MHPEPGRVWRDEWSSSLRKKVRTNQVNVAEKIAAAGIKGQGGQVELGKLAL